MCPKYEKLNSFQSNNQVRVFMLIFKVFMKSETS